MKPRTPRVVFLLATLWILLAGVIVYWQLATPPRIAIEWETETEFETAGFNIYRSDREGGPFVKINERIIPSKADPAAGAVYSYVDEGMSRGKTYYYRLEDIEYDSSVRQQDILSGQAAPVSGWALLLAGFSGLIGALLLASGFRQKASV